MMIMMPYRSRPMYKRGPSGGQGLKGKLVIVGGDFEGDVGKTRIMYL